MMKNKKSHAIGTRAFEFHRKQLITLQEIEKDKNVVDTQQNFELRQKLTCLTLRRRSCEQKNFIEVLNKKYFANMSQSKENREIMRKVVEVQRANIVK
jgi:hypothetical protein